MEEHGAPYIALALCAGDVPHTAPGRLSHLVAWAPHRGTRARCPHAPLGRPADARLRGAVATDSERNLPPPSSSLFNRHGGVAMQSAARIVGLAFLAALAACESLSNPAQTPDTPRASTAEAVPGQYIVVLQNSVADPATVASDLVNAAGGSLLHVYSSAIKGFAARLSAPAAAALQGNPLVASVEADQVMRADVT